MADKSPFLAIRQMTLNPAAFSDVVPPIDCNSVVIFNSGGDATAIRSDPANATTEDTIGAGEQETYTGPPGEVSTGAPRFKAGNAICSLKPASTVGPAILKYCM